MKKTAIMAVAVAAGATLPLFATIVDTFESDAGGWTGGATKEETVTYSGIKPTTVSGTQVLAFEGTATRPISGETDPNIIDMMCKIAALEDPPATYSTDVENALFAIAVDPDHKLQVYCKASANATAAAFTPISGTTTYTEGAWVRITAAINYTTKTFQLAVDGTISPATYYLAKASASTIASVKAIGNSSIDDFVVKSDANSALDVYAQVNANGSAATTTVGTDTIPTSYLTATKKTAETVGVDTIPNSTLTYLKAYLAGVDPADGAKFSVTSAQVTDSAVTLSFPGSWPANTYKIKYGTAPGAITTVATASSATKENGANKVTVPLSFSGTGTGTLYFSVSR